VPSTDKDYMNITSTDSRHINTITAKANSKLGFVKRNININNRADKEQAYKSLVKKSLERPVLEYCQAVWDPCIASDTQQLVLP